MAKLMNMKNIEEPMGFGKYDYLSLLEVAFYEPDYLEWMRNQDYIWFSETVDNFLAEIASGLYDYHSYNYEPDYDMEDDDDYDFSLRNLIDDYLQRENEVYPKQKILQEQREDNQRRNIESMRNVPTDQDIQNYVWGYYASGKMKEDTSFGKLRWKKIKKDIQDRARSYVYKTKFQLGELFLIKELYLKEEDGKWYGKYYFLTDDSIKVVIKKTEKESPKALIEMIESCL